jgi:hypothetical protein
MHLAINFIDRFLSFGPTVARNELQVRPIFFSSSAFPLLILILLLMECPLQIFFIERTRLNSGVCYGVESNNENDSFILCCCYWWLWWW